MPLYDSNREAFRECVKIINLLTSLNEKYMDLKVSAVRGDSSFDETIVRFSRTLGRAKRKIGEFIVRYGVSPITECNMTEGTLKLGFKRGISHGIKTMKPITMQPSLLRELMRGMPKPLNVTEIVNRRVSEQLREQGFNLLRPREASRMLGVSFKTLWRWWKEGKIQAVRLPSRRLRYPREEIERILHSKPRK